MKSGKLPFRYRKNTIALILIIIIISAIFSPYPKVDAVRIALKNTDIQDGFHDTIDLKITAQNPSSIRFPGGTQSETIPNGEIRVTLDPGTVYEKITSFNFNGNLLTDNTGGIITDLVFGGITHGTSLGTFGSGPYYGYGLAFFSGVFRNGTIGNGTVLSGISSNPYPGDDTTGSYQIKFKPSLLSVGSHVIRVDVLAKSNDVNFFSSGNVSFTNSPSTMSLHLNSTQQLVGNLESQVTVEPSKSQLVIVSSNANLSTISIPSTVTTPTINYSSILSSSGGSNKVSLSHALTINKYFNGMSSSLAQLTIQANSTITGPSNWNGILNLPTIKPNFSLPPPTQAGKSSTITRIMEVGFDSTELSLSVPARLVFAGYAGEHIGYSHGGPLQEIVSSCTSDTSSGIPVGKNECKINNGNDLVVWTNHFSSFASWNSLPLVSDVISNQGGSGVTYDIINDHDNSITSKIVSGSSIPNELKIYQISWDTCTKNTATVLGSTNGDPSDLQVLIHEPNGVIHAALASVQPLVQQNAYKKSTMVSYQFPLSKQIPLDVTMQDSSSIVTTPVTISGCTGTLVITPIIQNSDAKFDNELTSQEQNIPISESVITSTEFTPDFQKTQDGSTTIQSVITSQSESVINSSTHSDVLYSYGLVKNTDLEKSISSISYVLFIPVIILLSINLMKRKSHVTSKLESLTKLVHQGEKVKKNTRSSTSSGYESIYSEQLKSTKQMFEQYDNTLRSTLEGLQDLKNKRRSISDQLNNAKKEIESTKEEFAALQLEEKHLISEIQSVKAKFIHVGSL